MQGFLVFQIWNSRPVLKSTSADNKRNAGRETAATDSREAHFTSVFPKHQKKWVANAIYEFISSLKS